MIVRHSFANPLWWSYHLFSLPAYYRSQGVQY